MTTDRNTLLKLIKEYGDSLLRIESEKDLEKAIAEQAEAECQVKPALEPDCFFDLFGRGCPDLFSGSAEASQDLAHNPRRIRILRSDQRR